MVITEQGPPVVHIADFQMSFGSTRVITGLSFDVFPGETFGLLGSNGSGKTTTIRALLGIYIPTAGVLHVNGAAFNPAQSAVLGYLPEERGLYKKESVLDTMVYFGRLKGMAPGAARAWSLAYLDRVGLLDKPKVRLDKLSGGEQQKVQLGVTIMNNPQLLILDEPTKGFDPVNRRLLMSIVEERKQAGATIIMVTHQMDDVEKLCDRIILLKDGQAHAYGTVAAVQEQFGGTTIKIEADRSLPASPWYTVLSDEHGHSEIALTKGATPAAVLTDLVDAGVAVASFVPGRRSLESIFVAVYGSKEVD
jgi:ABC-2 type transport system ATP-binding protein